MPDVRPFQTNWTAGVFSPLLEGRVDIARYANAALILQNFVALPHGPAQRRPGTHFVAEVKDSTTPVRLVEFIFSDEQAYILEFGEQYIRFYMDGGQIESSPGVPYEIASPYASADLALLRWVATGDIAYFFHPDYATHKLSRAGHTDWSLTQVSFQPPPSVEADQNMGVTIAPGAVSGNGVTFTAGGSIFLAADVDRQIVSGASRAIIQSFTSGTQVVCDIIEPFDSTDPIPVGDWVLTGSPNGTTCDPDKKEPVGATVTLTAAANAFRSTDVGAYVRLNGGLVKITTFTSATVVKGEILVALAVDTAAAVGTWSIERDAWSTERGFPRCGTFFSGRLWMASTREEPQAAWGSAADDFENFGLGANDAEAVAFTLATDRVNVIRWLVPSKFLLVGTSSDEQRILGRDNGRIITPSEVNAVPETAHGSHVVAPVRIGAVVLFPQKSGRKLREMAFVFDDDGYRAPDLSLLAEHLFEDGGILEMAFQPEPYPVLWIVTHDGRLLGVTYERSQDVVGWHAHTTQGLFESVAVIPVDDIGDQVWVVVNRTVGGVTKRYVEYLDDATGFHGRLGMDSALTYTGAPATVFSGLDHLEGLDVTIVADGEVRTPDVVTGGEVTLDAAASQVEIGLAFTSHMKTLRPEVSDAGTTQTLQKRWVECVARVYRSGSFLLNGERSEFRLPEQAMDEAVPLFSGDVKVMNLGYDLESRIEVIGDLPLPLTLVAITGLLSVGDE